MWYYMHEIMHEFIMYSYHEALSVTYVLHRFYFHIEDMSKGKSQIQSISFPQKVSLATQIPYRK